MAQSKHTVEGPARKQTKAGRNVAAESVPTERAVERAPEVDVARPSIPADASVHEPTKASSGDVLAEAAKLALSGSLQDAAAAYRGHLTLHPDDVLARRSLASVLEQRGDYAGALGELGRAIDAQPEDVSLLCGRAAVQMAMQRYDQAENDLRRASKIDADRPEVLFNLGMLFCKKALWRDAIEPLQRVVELDASNPQGHYYLGEAYNQTDQLDLALASYEEAVRLQPTNYRALKGVGIVLDKLGRPAEATAAYQRAREAQRR